MRTLNASQGIGGRATLSRAWLATYLQGRRRERLAAMVPEGELGLQDGLLQFYVPEDSVAYLRSWGESAVPGEELFGGAFNPMM